MLKARQAVRAGAGPGKEKADRTLQAKGQDQHGRPDNDYS
jgi:hypothetical protein